MSQPQVTMGDVSTIHPRLAYPNLRLVLQAWTERMHPEDFPWLPPAPEDVEVPFAFPLEEGVCVCRCPRTAHKLATTSTGKKKRSECNTCGDCPTYQELHYTGVMDWRSLHRTRKGTLIVGDHKTTGRIDQVWLDQWEISTQVTGYIWANSRHCGEPCHTAFIHGIELNLLPGSTRRCTLHGLPYEDCQLEHARFEIIEVQRSEAELNFWKAEVQRLAAHYRLLRLRYPEPGRHFALPAQGRFADACRYCTFHSWCVSGRPDSLASCGLEQRIWDPLAHADPEQKTIRRRSSAFYVDNSTLKNVAACDSRTVARHVWNYSGGEEGGALAAGTAWHKAMEAWFKVPKGGRKAAEAAQAALAQAYGVGAED